MNEFIHIGYPKNFSTTLQRDFFSKHEKIFYLGIGLETSLGYKTPIIEKAFELYLKSAKYFKYCEFEEKLIQDLKRLREQAKTEGASCMVVSSEHLSFAFTHDSIDIREKFKRLKRVFNSPKIILIIRNQFDLIKSLYKESIRVGLKLSFEEYLYTIYKYQDRNFIYDFRYDLVIQQIEEIFGYGMFELVFFENYKDENGLISKNDTKINLIEDLCKILRIDYPSNFNLGHQNEALNSNLLYEKLRLNKLYTHDLGNHLLESAEKHRIKRYLEEDLKLHEPDTVLYNDVITKRSLIQQSSKGDGLNVIDFKCNLEIERTLKEFYERGNLVLKEKYKLNVLDHYFNLKF